MAAGSSSSAQAASAEDTVANPPATPISGRAQHTAQAAPSANIGFQNFIRFL
jgi:hypothetical protein